MDIQQGRMGQAMEAMKPVAASVGVDVEVQAGDGSKRSTAHVLNVLKPLLEVCDEVGKLVRNEGLYLRGERVVTIDPDGTERVMTERRFISFLPKFCVVSKGKDEDGRPRRIDLSSQRAGEILDSDTFRQMIPKVTRILPSRLPVYTADKKDVRLLPKGYDAEHGVFVTKDAPEIESWDIDDATAYWRNIYKTFPWGDSGRSLAAQLSAQVGMFVQMLFPEALAVPGFFWNSNMEGSGKSIMAEMVVSPVYGHCETGDFGQGEEFLKRLMSRALGYSSYFFMDDVEGFIKSQALNRWIVQTHWTDRRMHTHEEVTVPKRCLTMITGNGATLSDDLVRRMVVIDLFSEKSSSERLRERDQDKEVTSTWLSSKKTRAEMLSALWAMVRYWVDQGMPQAPRRIASFVDWTEVVGGIVYACGFGDPFAPAKLTDAGDKWQVEWETLFSAVVRRFAPDKTGVSIPLPEWCAVAREHGLYVEKLSDREMTRMHLDDNPKLWKIAEGIAFDESEKDRQSLRYMDAQKQASPFAKILRKKFGQTQEVDGRRYKFADRNTTNKSTFVVRDVTDGA